MQRDIDKVVFVCSQHVPWARAMARVLAAVTDLHAHPVLGISAEKIIQCMRRHGRYPDAFSEDICLVHLPGIPGEVEAQFIATVLRLRGNYEHWAGGIVVVVDGEEARGSLSKADLFGGESGGINALGRRRGSHRILVEPIHLADLLSETSSVGQVFRNAWRGWAKESPLGQIGHAAQDIKAHIHDGRCNEAILLFADLHTHWRRVDWRVICVHGRIQRLAMMISDLPTPDCVPCASEMLENIMEVLEDFGLGEW